MTKQELIISLPILKKSADENPNSIKDRYNYFKTLNELEKIYLEENDLQNSYKIIIEQFKYSENIFTSANSLGWNIYKHIKASENIDSYTIASFINILTSINFEKPSILYSAMARILTKINNGETWLLEYFKTNTLDHFSKDDLTPFIKEQRKFSPLAVSVVQKLAKIIENNNIADEYDWIKDYLEKLISKHPDEIWLKHHKGKILLLQGKVNSAREMIIEVLKKQKDQSWAWSLLGETYENEDTNLSISFFCKALILGQEEKMLLNTRLKLAQLLITKKLFSEAKNELEKIVKVREANKYKINGEIQKLLNSSQIKEANASKSNNEFYLENSSQAEEIFLDQFETAIGIVTNLLEDKPVAFLQISKDHSARVKTNKKNPLQTGDYCKIYFDRIQINSEEKLNVGKYEKTTPCELEFVKKRKGSIRVIEGKNFGFIEDIFIPAFLINANIKNGDEIEIIAVNDFNKMKNVYGWKGVKVIC